MLAISNVEKDSGQAFKRSATRPPQGFSFAAIRRGETMLLVLASSTVPLAERARKTKRPEPKPATVAKFECGAANNVMFRKRSSAQLRGSAVSDS
jgi:hypothetical protein